MKQTLILLFSAAIFISTGFTKLQAAPAYEIKIKIRGFADTTFYLANFYAKNQYYRDTARTNSKGVMVFTGEEDLEQGMYALVLGNRKIFDFFVIEKFMEIETDTIETIKNLKIKGSPENSAFFSYINYLSAKEVEVQPIQKNLKDGNKKEKEQAKLDLKRIDLEVDSFQSEFLEKNKDLFVAKFLKSMNEVEVPEPPVNEDGSIDSSFQYRYFKEHYFDNIDFTDARYLRTPVYHQKMTEYIQKYTYQIPDSLYKSIDFVVEKARANEELFRYTVSWITNTYEKSKIMGMDGVFVHMAEKYYLTDDVDWIDSTQRAKIQERYVKNKPLLIGKIAPNIVLADTAQKEWYNLHKIDAPYTLVYIWSPTCGHCKKITPKMHKLYLKYKEYGFKVFAVGTEFENVEWIKYIKTHNLTWINVSDSPENPNNIKDYPLNFRNNYDVYSTPKIYLIDKDKKIVAKTIEDEQLDEFLGRVFNVPKEEETLEATPVKEKEKEKEKSKKKK